MRGRIVEHTLDPWISKLVGAILVIQGSGERYWLGLSIHGSFETNQNSGEVWGGRIVEHTLDPWISKLVGAILAIQGSGERYWLGLSIHGSFETNQNSGEVWGGG